MAAVIPLAPKAEAISIHTGNIVNWNRLKKKLTQSPREELVESIGSTLDNWVSGADRNKLQYATSLECLNKKFIEKLPPNGREEFKITVKICLCRLDQAAITEAVDKVLAELGVGHIETLILSVPQNHQSVREMAPLWEVMEGLVEQEKVFSLGVSDLDTQQLKELHAHTKVKPCINQVNLDVCCVIPPEMVEFAKEQDIQLLTHNDPKDLLCTAALQQVLRDHVTERDGVGWDAAWLVRYSVLIKARGIIKAKAYIAKATRNLARQGP